MRESISISLPKDRDGDWVLATAVMGACRCVVTGDKDLLTLDGYDGIRILGPRGFCVFE